MASTFTTRMRYEKQADGENSNTWGGKVNTVWDLLDEARGGFLSKSVAGASDVTLTANNSATDENRQAVIDFTGLLTGNINVIVQTAESWWLLQNSTTGSFTLTVKTSAGLGIAITQGEWAILYSDGTDVKKVLATDDFVTGPSSSTDRSLALFDGTTGVLLKDGPALGSSTNVLTSNGAGSDPTFQAIPAPNIVDDTSPQLGGALDTNAFTIDFSEGANVASAASPNIWSSDGNTIHITGTTGITGFAAAPRAGAWKWLIFDAAVLLTDSATLNLPGDTNYTTALDDIVYVFAETTTVFKLLIFPKDGTAVVGGASDGELRSVQVFEATGGNTWTKPAGLVRVRAIVVGAGGGGGSSGTTNGLAGGGGGGGGYAEELLEASALGATETATVGAGGAGGASGANDGVGGGTSSFGALLSATGGAGGPQGTTGSVIGAAGGVGSGGSFNVGGGGGGAGIEDATNFDPVTGRGGETPLGGGTRTVHRKSTNSVGGAGNAYGGGGEGGARRASNAAGGNGADGIVIVWEYF